MYYNVPGCWSWFLILYIYIDFILVLYVHTYSSLKSKILEYLPDPIREELKNKSIKLGNNQIDTLKSQTTNNHSTWPSSLQATFIENTLQYIHNQFVVATIDKANGKAFSVLAENLQIWS